MPEPARRWLRVAFLAGALLFALAHWRTIASIGRPRAAGSAVRHSLAAGMPSPGIPTGTAAAAAAAGPWAYEALTPEKQARLGRGLGRNPFSAASGWRGATGRGTASRVAEAGPAGMEAGGHDAWGLPVLSAISLKGDSGCAVLNGRVVQPGDPVSGYVVEEIGPDGVLLRRGERTWHLRLGEK